MAAGEWGWGEGWEEPVIQKSAFYNLIPWSMSIPFALFCLLEMSLEDMELPWAGTRQGWAHRNRARSPHCRALQPTCWSELTLSTSEQDLN